MLVCMNVRAKELLEKGLEKARNKKITRKKYEKILKMNHWQKDTDNAWILRDYKTFLLYIVKDTGNKFHCSFSGDKMSRYSSFADSYNDLKQAKHAMEQFIDAYNLQINGIDSE